MEIKVFGEEKRLLACKDYLSSENGGGVGRLFLYPIPTSRDGAHLSGIDISFSEAAREADERTLAVGYDIPTTLRAELTARGANIYDLSVDERFLTENARLTALGTLGFVLSNIPLAPYDMEIGVVGYGRIGSSLVRLLLFLGASVRVYTTKETVRLSLCEAGVRAELIDVKTAPYPLDLLINTAPVRVFSENVLSAMPKNLKIIELASGDNFLGAGELIRLPSVPARSYPESAGRIMAECVQNRLRYSSGEVVL